jgi:hypothetical protein
MSKERQARFAAERLEMEAQGYVHDRARHQRDAERTEKLSRLNREAIEAYDRGNKLEFERLSKVYFEVEFGKR